MTRRIVAIAVGAWLLLSLALWASGWEPDVIVLGGIVVAGTVGLLVVVDVVLDVRGASWPSRRDRVDVDRRQRERAQVLAGDLYQSEWSDPVEIRVTLLDVMDRRLVATYGVERAAQPEAADELLTPRLRRLAAAPSRRLTGVGEIRSILSDIEEL